jgi:hypothetical protein
MPKPILADLCNVEKNYHLKINYKSDEVRSICSNWLQKKGKFYHLKQGSELKYK